MRSTWQSPSWRPFLIGLLFLFPALFVGPLVGTVASLPFHGWDLQAASKALGAMDESNPLHRWGALVAQGVSSLVMFTVWAWAYARFVEKRPFGLIYQTRAPRLADLAWVAVVMVSFMVADLELIRWNSEWTWLQQFDWLVQQQEKLDAMSAFLLDVQGPGQFLLLFVVVAVIAGVGEELIFRGMLQRNLYWATSNPHVAIWGAAVLFSAFHFQFFGFFPRLALGLLFGYMYWWSGTIWVPIAAHVLNNGLIVLVVYANRHEQDALQLNEVPEIWDLSTAGGWALYAAVVATFAAALWAARRHWTRQHQAS